MRPRIVLLALGTLFISAQAIAVPMHLWSKVFTSSGIDDGLSVATDGSGNVVAAGIFQLSIDFGGGYLSGFPSTFVAKYNASGAHMWSRSFASFCEDMATDGAGNVMVTGVASGPVDFGGGVMPGGLDVYICKFDANGAFVWARRYAGVGTERDARGVAADALGNIFITGNFTGTINLGGGTLTSAGSNDIFLAKYDAAGAHVWSKRLGAAGYDIGYGVDVDGAGNVIATGNFSGTVNFGGGNLTSVGAGDIFLVKYDASGLHQWSKRVGGSVGENGDAVAVDPVGNVVITGNFSGTANFGGSNLTSPNLFRERSPLPEVLAHYASGVAPPPSGSAHPMLLHIAEPS